MHSLEGKIALVTGGTSGIGLAVAKNFVECGATVVVTGLRTDGDELASRCNLNFVRCDASNEEQVSDLFAHVLKSFGRIDLLVINAGIASDEESIETFDFSDMKKIIDVNVNGVFLALKYGPSKMAAGGSIIATGSVAGCGTTNPGAGVYAASKAAVAYLIRTSALELASRRIRANTVCPAVISGTGMMTEDNGSPEATFLGRLTALGRMGHLNEVVGVYNFLASDSSSFVTGQEFRIDGGMTAGLTKPIISALGH